MAKNYYTESIRVFMEAMNDESKQRRVFELAQSMFLNDPTAATSQEHPQWREAQSRSPQIPRDEMVEGICWYAENVVDYATLHRVMRILERQYNKE